MWVKSYQTGPYSILLSLISATPSHLVVETEAFADSLRSHRRPDVECVFVQGVRHRFRHVRAAVHFLTGVLRRFTEDEVVHGQGKITFNAAETSLVKHRADVHAFGGVHPSSAAVT